MSGLTKKPIGEGDYLLLCKQSGEGCDYTIACGTAVINLGPCLSDEQAADKAFAEFGPDGMGLTGERRLSEAVLVQGRVVPFDLGAVYRLMEEAEERERAAKEKARELKQLEDLEKKYRGK